MNAQSRLFWLVFIAIIEFRRMFNFGKCECIACSTPDTIHRDMLIHRVHNYKNQIIRREFEIGYTRVPKTNQFQRQTLDESTDNEPFQVLYSCFDASFFFKLLFVEKNSISAFYGSLQSISVEFTQHFSFHFFQVFNCQRFALTMRESLYLFLFQTDSIEMGIN